MEKPITFTRHAEFKLLLLGKHGFRLSKRDVQEVLREPIRIRQGYAGRKIAEQPITNEHLLRVVFEESASEIKVITMYPARRNRYES